MLKDYKNLVFFDWTVIEKDPNDKTVRSRKWICQHSCGYKKSCKIDSIYNPKGVRCNKCWRSQFKNNLNSRFYEEIKQGAKKRNKQFLVNRKYLMDLLISQDFKCSLTGLPIWTANSLNNHSQRETTASLDRIDNNKDYVEGNVRWVHKIVNLMRSNFSDYELFFWCIFVVIHNISLIDDLLIDQDNLINFLCKKKFKQKYTLTEDKITKIREEYLSGESAASLEKIFNISKPTIKKYIKDIIDKKNETMDQIYNENKYEDYYI